MKMVRLDRRLERVASMVRQDAFLVDVGTDHGYLIGNLAASGKISGGIAADINEKPLDKARQYIRLLGVEDQVACALSDGFQNVGGDFTDGVAAGMGGDLIARIVLDFPASRDEGKRFILQPMTKADVLRTLLWENGFSLLREEAVASAGKCYTVMLWQYSGEGRTPNLAERYLGRVLEFLTEDTQEYLRRTSSYLEKKSRGIADTDEKREYIHLLERISLEMERLQEKRC